MFGFQPIWEGTIARVAFFTIFFNLVGLYMSKAHKKETNYV